MDQDAQEHRKIQIETAAYGLLALKGYKATSMLEVAKRAKASNETLYKWYGNKQGLFLSMVRRNADAARQLLERALETGRALPDVLDEFGAQFLQMVASERAVVLTRAAAGDVHDTGLLGRTITESGRAALLPLLTEAIRRHNDQADAADAAEAYLDLLVGDLQIRRVIGVAGMVPANVIEERASRASRLLFRMIG